MSWMSPKERFYTCVAHQQPDRPPIQFYTTPELEAKLQERFPGQNLLEVLEVDFRTLWVPSTAVTSLRLRIASSPIHRWTTCLPPMRWSLANGCASRKSLCLLSNRRLVV